MANWARLQEQLTGLPVVKRAKHSIHFDKGNGEIVANFSGARCHYEDKGVWKPIDTTLLLGADGFYGCPHSPVKVHKDGRVKVDKSDYSQFTKLPGSPVGKVDGDRIVREFPGGYQELFVTEDGFREVITVVKRTFPIEKFIGKTSGTLPSAYKASPQTAVDANGDVFEITSDTKAFGNWLNKAVYPVVIDPDFASASGTSREVFAKSTNYSTARETPTNIQSGSQYYIGIGQNKWSTSNYEIWRSFLKFDTSSITAGNVVTQVNLKLYVTYDYSETDFDVQVTKCDWSSYDPITKDNMNSVYDLGLSSDLDALWLNTNGLGTGWKTGGNLTTSWVNRTDTTYYGLRSKREYDATTPTGDEHITIYGYNAGLEQPVLSVTYTAAATGALRRTNMNAQMQSLTGGFN